MKKQKILSLLLSAVLSLSFTGFSGTGTAEHSLSAGSLTVAAEESAAVTTTVAGGNTFALLATSYDIRVGETATIARCGTAVPDSWDISGSDIISLDSTGLKVKGLSAGTAVITYSGNGVTSQAVINVTDSTKSSFTDKVVYTAGQFVFFSRNGAFKLDSSVFFPDSNPFERGNTVNTEFEYRARDDIPVITSVKSTEVLSSEEQPDDMPLSDKFTDTIEDVNSSFVQFREHGRYYLNTDYAMFYSKEFTRLDAGEECTADFMYREYEGTKVIINITELDSSETDVCTHCEKEVPRNHIISTTFGYRVCDDCKDFGWCGNFVQEEFTDYVTATYGGGYIRFQNHGRYNTSKATDPFEGPELSSLRKGDKVHIEFECVSTYEAKIYDILKLEVLDDTVTDASSASSTTSLTTASNITTTSTTTVSADTRSTSTTTEEPEVWRWGTGVDHFRSIKTLPTKTIYDEGDEFDLSGLVIDAYHSAIKYSNKGRAEEVITNYNWEVERVDQEYITIIDLAGKTYTTDEFSTLRAGNAYTVKFGKKNYPAINLYVKGEKYEKELYDIQDLSFRVYINPADKKSKFIRIDDAEVEEFAYGTVNHGFKLKDMDAFSIDMDAYMWASYKIEGDIRKGDTVSGVLCIKPESNYIVLGDLEIVKYTGETGDANADGSIDMADAVIIMQALANPNRYGLEGSDERHITNRGFALGDLNSNGLTVNDAQLIQNMLLGIK